MRYFIRFIRCHSIKYRMGIKKRYIIKIRVMQ